MGVSPVLRVRVTGGLDAERVTVVWHRTDAQLEREVKRDAVGQPH